MAVPVSELQKAGPSAIIELFILELDSTIHGSQPQMTWRFHPGTNQNNNGHIVFNGQSYTKLPLEAEGFEYNGKQLPRPKLRVSNILGTFSTILSSLSMGLEGAKVTRRRTLLRYLANELIDFIEGQYIRLILSKSLFLAKISLQSMLKK